ncbi:hypothetical protein Slin15195_G069920 [Septoria linicola]|uniref:Uncharacterized protein n=1 Tax=Septoria linicola TaxID=215465 RepID=A0A9Q9ELQ5_9PEZI|nr:hypothetical protein Slin15195_G069920 [Septoria linicola]
MVSSTFLSMMKGMTPSGAFGFYAAICEVSGLTLEEINEVFKHGFGVRYARQLRKDRREEVQERPRTQEKRVALGH